MKFPHNNEFISKHKKPFNKHKKKQIFDYGIFSKAKLAHLCNYSQGRLVFFTDSERISEFFSKFCYAVMKEIVEY